MGEARVEIERVSDPTDEHVQAFARLIPQLSSAAPPSLSVLREIVSNPATYLYVARVDGTIVGSLTLITFAISTGLRAWVEDVVVDGANRGAGVGSSLVRHAIEEARHLGAMNVDLTSRPSRIEANLLYQRLGFLPRETNIYRYNID